ncbi:MAG TPA: ankyrin repeat domain-containing protein [Pyrinomonadaceae bacterium]|nr:ankyrin repeat domain-containing protein [Pyrinomonadaceae bacterium]
MGFRVRGKKNSDARAAPDWSREELLSAAARGRASDVERLLAAGADVEARSAAHNYTALVLAAAGRHTSVVEILLGGGADVDAKDVGGKTSLIHAATVGDEAVVEALLNAGADVNARDSRGLTALMWAVSAGHAGVVKVLLEAGADAGAEDECGRTAFDHVRGSGGLNAGFGMWLFSSRSRRPDKEMTRLLDAYRAESAEDGA